MDVTILKINEQSYNIKDTTARTTAQGASTAAQEASTAAQKASTAAQEAKNTANSANSAAQEALKKSVSIEYAEETITFTLGV